MGSFAPRLRVFPQLVSKTKQIPPRPHHPSIMRLQPPTFLLAFVAFLLPLAQSSGDSYHVIDYSTSDCKDTNGDQDLQPATVNGPCECKDFSLSSGVPSVGSINIAMDSRKYTIKMYAKLGCEGPLIATQPPLDGGSDVWNCTIFKNLQDVGMSWNEYKSFNVIII